MDRRDSDQGESPNPPERVSLSTLFHMNKKASSDATPAPQQPTRIPRGMKRIHKLSESGSPKPNQRFLSSPNLREDTRTYVPVPVRNISGQRKFRSQENILSSGRKRRSHRHTELRSQDDLEKYFLIDYVKPFLEIYKRRKLQEIQGKTVMSLIPANISVAEQRRQFDSSDDDFSDDELMENRMDMEKRQSLPMGLQTLVTGAGVVAGSPPSGGTFRKNEGFLEKLQFSSPTRLSSSQPSLIDSPEETASPGTPIIVHSGVPIMDRQKAGSSNFDGLEDRVTNAHNSVGELTTDTKGEEDIGENREGNKTMGGVIVTDLDQKAKEINESMKGNNNEDREGPEAQEKSIRNTTDSLQGRTGPNNNALADEMDTRQDDSERGGEKPFDAAAGPRARTREDSPGKEDNLADAPVNNQLEPLAVHNTDQSAALEETQNAPNEDKKGHLVHDNLHLVFDPTPMLVAIPQAPLARQMAEASETWMKNLPKDNLDCSTMDITVDGSVTERYRDVSIPDLKKMTDNKLQATERRDASAPIDTSSMEISNSFNNEKNTAGEISIVDKRSSLIPLSGNWKTDRNGQEDQSRKVWDGKFNALDSNARENSSASNSDDLMSVTIDSLAEPPSLKVKAVESKLKSPELITHVHGQKAQDVADVNKESQGEETDAEQKSKQKIPGGTDDSFRSRLDRFTEEFEPLITVDWKSDSQNDSRTDQEPISMETIVSPEVMTTDEVRETTFIDKDKSTDQVDSDILDNTDSDIDSDFYESENGKSGIYEIQTAEDTDVSEYKSLEMCDVTDEEDSCVTLISVSSNSTLKEDAVIDSKVTLNKNTPSEETRIINEQKIKSEEERNSAEITSDMSTADQDTHFIVNNAQEINVSTRNMRSNETKSDSTRRICETQSVTTGEHSTTEFGSTDDASVGHLPGSTAKSWRLDMPNIMAQTESDNAPKTTNEVLTPGKQEEKQQDGISTKSDTREDQLSDETAARDRATLKLSSNAHQHNGLISYEEVKIVPVDEKVKIVAGDEKVKIVAGDEKVKIVTGDEKVKIVAGDEKVKTVTGDEKVKIVTGDDKVKIVTGDKKVKNVTGDDKVKTADRSEKEGFTGRRLDMPHIMARQTEKSSAIGKQPGVNTSDKPNWDGHNAGNIKDALQDNSRVESTMMQPNTQKEGRDVNIQNQNIMDSKDVLSNAICVENQSGKSKVKNPKEWRLDLPHVMAQNSGLNPDSQVERTLEDKQTSAVTFITEKPNNFENSSSDAIQKLEVNEVPIKSESKTVSGEAKHAVEKEIFNTDKITEFFEELFKINKNKSLAGDDTIKQLIQNSAFQMSFDNEKTFGVSDTDMEKEKPRDHNTLITDSSADTDGKLHPIDVTTLPHKDIAIPTKPAIEDTKTLSNDSTEKFEVNLNPNNNGSALLEGADTDEYVIEVSENVKNATGEMASDESVLSGINKEILLKDSNSSHMMPTEQHTVNVLRDGTISDIFISVESRQTEDVCESKNISKVVVNSSDNENVVYVDTSGGSLKKTQLVTKEDGEVTVSSNIVISRKPPNEVKASPSGEKTGLISRFQSIFRSRNKSSETQQRVSTITFDEECSQTKRAIAGDDHTDSVKLFSENEKYENEAFESMAAPGFKEVSVDTRDLKAVNKSESVARDSHMDEVTTGASVKLIPKNKEVSTLTSHLVTSDHIENLTNCLLNGPGKRGIINNDSSTRESSSNYSQYGEVEMGSEVASDESVSRSKDVLKFREQDPATRKKVAEVMKELNETLERKAFAKDTTERETEESCLHRDSANVILELTHTNDKLLTNGAIQAVGGVPNGLTQTIGDIPNVVTQTVDITPNIVTRKVGVTSNVVTKAVGVIPSKVPQDVEAIPQEVPLNGDKQDAVFLQQKNTLYQCSMANNETVVRVQEKQKYTSTCPYEGGNTSNNVLTGSNYRNLDPEEKYRIDQIINSVREESRVEEPEVQGGVASIIGKLNQNPGLKSPIVYNSLYDFSLHKSDVKTSLSNISAVSSEQISSPQEIHSDKMAILPTDRNPLPIDRTPLPIERTPLPTDRTPLPIDRNPLPIDRTPLPAGKTPPPVIKTHDVTGVSMDTTPAQQIKKTLRTVKKESRLKSGTAVKPQMSTRIALLQQQYFDALKEDERKGLQKKSDILDNVFTEQKRSESSEDLLSPTPSNVAIQWSQDKLTNLLNLRDTQNDSPKHSLSRSMESIASISNMGSRASSVASIPAIWIQGEDYYYLTDSREDSVTDFKVKEMAKAFERESRMKTVPRKRQVRQKPNTKPVSPITSPVISPRDEVRKKPAKPVRDMGDMLTRVSALEIIHGPPPVPMQRMKKKESAPRDLGSLKPQQFERRHVLSPGSREETGLFSPARGLSPCPRSEADAATPEIQPATFDSQSSTTSMADATSEGYSKFIHQESEQSILKNIHNKQLLLTKLTLTEEKIDAFTTSLQRLEEESSRTNIDRRRKEQLMGMMEVTIKKINTAKSLKEELQDKLASCQDDEG